MDNDFRVGPWLVQPSLNTISQNGTSTRVEPKVMEVLVCLSHHAGKPVSKEELLETVWPDTFVSDDVLKRSVSELRRVFEDDARESRIIETIPKRGYRLLEAVQPVNGSLPKTADPQPAESSLPSSRQSVRTWRIAVTAFTIIALVCGGLFALNPAGLRDRLLGRNTLVMNSLAVLPLQNLSGDPSQDYFANGMTEELITELSRLSSLRVISRTSVMRYKNANKPLPEIARELGVEGIVAGSVLRSGDQVRITAQLIYAPQDKNIWAQSYERDVKDVLALQSAVASSIAKEIRVQMTPGEQAQISSSRSVNLQAHEAYFQGRYHLQQAQNALFKKDKGKVNEEEAERSVNYFQQAVQADPSYAPSYVGVWDAWSASQLAPRDYAPRARPIILKALQLDDTLASAHDAMASIWQTDWNWHNSEKEFQRAIQLEPSSADFHSHYSRLLFELGRAQEGMKEAETTQALDPKNERMADSYYLSREFDRAIELYQSRAQMMPSDFSPHFVLSDIYALTGRQQDAIVEVQKMLTILEYQKLAASIGIVYKTSGYQQALRFYAKQLEEIYSHATYIPTWYIASIYGFSGDKDQAFAWLEKAYKVKDSVDSLASDPQWDPLRADPRFEDLLRRIGLPKS
ncbi:MAG TPA: winged helix-turn-helix domain-containing protein [Candidatus Sulfotelmatobacter sp.]|nr:winged helix-turn-helix domain-containing protein [Candidatus Sulfotelmatobacter sp.]